MITAVIVTVMSMVLVATLAMLTARRGRMKRIGANMPPPAADLSPNHGTLP